MNTIHRPFLNRMICNSRGLQLRRKIGNPQNSMRVSSFSSIPHQKRRIGHNLYVSFIFQLFYLYFSIALSKSCFKAASNRLAERDGDLEKQKLLDDLNLGNNKFSRTDDDIEDEMSGLQATRQTLGGLQNVQLMNEKVEQLKKANEIFYINIDGNNLEFDYRHDDQIFTLTAKN